MIKKNYRLMDVFSKIKYSGNPLAVFMDASSISDMEMQKIAAEINYSETTFITDSSHDGKNFHVRIFTPAREVEFAGHPLIGTGYIIRKYLAGGRPDPIILQTKSGPVEVHFPFAGEDDPVFIKQHNPQFGEMHSKNNFASILSLSEDEISPDPEIQDVSTGLPCTVVPLGSLESLKKIKINKEIYMNYVSNRYSRVILAFSRETYEKHHDISVRVFAPYYGVEEDAATGSANGALAAYLLKNSSERALNLVSGQGYEMNRPSQLFLKAEWSGDVIHVETGGSVVEVGEGSWFSGL